MFDNIPYITKFKILIVLLVCLSIAAYRRSFSTLIAVIKENKTLNEKVQKINSKNTSLKVLNKELASLNLLIGKEGLNKQLVQHGIVSFVTNNSKNVSIFNLQSIHEFKDTDFTIFSNQLDLTGNFNDLNKIAYLFENKFNLSKVVSLNFFTEKKNNKPDILHLIIIFQNYESIK